MVISKYEHLWQPVDADARFAARMLIRTARYGALALNDVENGAANHPDIRMIFSHFDGKSYIPHERATN